MNIFDKFRISCKRNKFSNFFYNIMKFIYYYCFMILIAKKKYPKIARKLSTIHIRSIISTVDELIYSNKSLGRFGDGEISWMLNKNSGLDSFERPSRLLSNRLLQVFRSNNSNFMIGLPDQFITLDNSRRKSKDYFIRFIIKNFSGFFPLLRKDVIYYNTNVTRPYIDFYNKKNSGLIFYLMKQVWKNKNVLIIEGQESRVGVKDDLLNNVNCIKRIECPTTDAFESYNKILNCSLNFLTRHKNFVSLISLGPTATILSYDLCKNGFRAIDIGNIDVEYNWYLLGVNKKVNLPYKYVNELINGQNALSIKNDTKYNKEIVNRI